MEEYRTEDGKVYKYVHDDGSETAIKTVSSCDNIFNKATGKIEPVEVDRNKFSCFISSSVGCPIGCKFCYLTVKKFPYHPLLKQDIEHNAKAALHKRFNKSDWNINPDKYMKLSWMGMGDALLLDPIKVAVLTEEIIEWVLEMKCALGIDGVDIATVLPHKKKGWLFGLGMLNMMLQKYPINPTSKDRSRVRLFYSLHFLPDLIPLKRNFYEDMEFLQRVNDDYGVEVIFHHMFLDGLNDNKNKLDNLRRWMESSGFKPELRILRYNECPNSPYKESRKFDELVKYSSDIFPKIKYQVSAGSEIKAACGQFLCERMVGK